MKEHDGNRVIDTLQGLWHLFHPILVHGRVKQSEILYDHRYHQHSDTIIFRASWTKVPGWLQIDDANEVMVRSEKRVCLLLAVVHVVAEVKL